MGILDDPHIQSLIHEAFPPQGEEKRAHEGSQSTAPSKDTPSKDYNQPVDLNRGKTVLPGQPGSTPPGFKEYE